MDLFESWPQRSQRFKRGVYRSQPSLNALGPLWLNLIGSWLPENRDFRQEIKTIEVSIPEGNKGQNGSLVLLVFRGDCSVLPGQPREKLPQRRPATRVAPKFPNRGIRLPGRAKNLPMKTFCYQMEPKNFLRGQAATRQPRKFFYGVVLVAGRVQKFSPDAFWYRTALKIFLRNRSGSRQS